MLTNIICLSIRTKTTLLSWLYTLTYNISIYVCVEYCVSACVYVHVNALYLLVIHKYFLLGTGTVRQNRLNKVPVKKKAIMEKKNIERGFTDIAYLEDVELVAWKDNRPVYVASNKYTGSANQTSKKWSRSEKKTVNVPTPDSVTQYNLSMGGVDIMDMMVSKYRTKYRRHKGYWPIFAWSINLQVVQAWRLRNKKNGVQEPLISFIRELTVGIFAQH